MDRMHPFFGNNRLLLPAESFLINQALADLDPDLDASTTYNLVHQFLEFKDTSHSERSVISTLTSVFERYMNWAFYVQHVSPLKMQSEHIIQFCNFYSAPAIAYVRQERSCKRFIEADDSLSVNPDWKPFYLLTYTIKHLGRVISILRAFFNYVSEIVPTRITVPRGSAGVFSTVPEPSPNDSILVERYFDALIDGIEKPVRKSRSRTSKNKQLLLFSTCYLLEIPFPRLANSTRFFSMASFYMEADTWYLSLQNDEETITRELPSRYIDILRDYRVSLGLHGMPESHEVEPIFASERAAKHVLDSLPVFEFMDGTIGLHLRKLVVQAGRTARTKNVSPVELSRAARARRTKKGLRVAVEILQSMDRDDIPARSLNHPVPLFNYHHSKSGRVEFVDFEEVCGRLQLCLGSLTDSDLSTVKIFACYANSERGQKNHLKVRALEKLVLWCVFFRGIDIAQLTEVDAVDFFRFCSLPPQDWCQPNRSPRTRTAGSFNAHWRPFYKLSEDPDLHLRAIRVIEWCKAIIQDLIDLSVLSYNPFIEISKRLGSSKQH